MHRPAFTMLGESAMLRPGNRFRQFLRHAVVVTALLAASGCAEEYDGDYDYRPVGWNPGWYSGSYGGHRGWYDDRGMWRGWHSRGGWHDEGGRGWHDRHRHDHRH
ncbi:hypothetical protein AA13594_1409 [Gluconacetobacter azotocaptans DSM 13594]|nr:hypothetical protein AA13594_1409 [Gluconacetobacter azotocaptans DSM 13594]